MELLFGKNAKVRITEFQYSTNMKQYYIEATLLTEFINESVEIFPDGLEIIIQDAYKLLNLSETFLLTTSIEYSKNGTSDITL